MTPRQQNYKVCSFCVMDSSIPAVQFDLNGQCNCCRDAIARYSHEWWPNDEGERRLDKLVQQLKADGKGRPYDAMIGLSGGIDSAYLAHVAVRKLGLRVLAVHVDGGWNSEPAVCNIELLVRQLNLDLITYVVEWQEMRELQLAFLRSSVVNQDMPQDHAFFSTLYRTAAKFKLNHFLSGVNFASECLSIPGYGHPSIDGRHVLAINKKFGVHPLPTYPVMGLVEYLWMTRVRRQLVIHRPLDFLHYDKSTATIELEREYGWRDYGGKHCESRFTKFYQEVYLPRKFGFDKRKLHLSSLIVAGQLSREAALGELEEPITTSVQMRRDIKFVAKKLGLEQEDLDHLINIPSTSHRNYPNSLAIYSALSLLRTYSRKLWKGR